MEGFCVCVCVCTRNPVMNSFAHITSKKTNSSTESYKTGLIKRKYNLCQCSGLLRVIVFRNPFDSCELLSEQKEVASLIDSLVELQSTLTKEFCRLSSTAAVSFLFYCVKSRQTDTALANHEKMHFINMRAKMSLPPSQKLVIKAGDCGLMKLILILSYVEQCHLTVEVTPSYLI